MALGAIVIRWPDRTQLRGYMQDGLIHEVLYRDPDQHADPCGNVTRQACCCAALQAAIVRPVPAVYQDGLIHDVPYLDHSPRAAQGGM